MELSPQERSLFLDLAWFPTDSIFLGHQLRPLSLATFKLIDIMNLRILVEDIELSPLQETKEIAAYVWLHSADKKDISLGMWDGSWRETMNESTEALPLVIKEFRALKQRLLSMIEAAGIEILPRPKSEQDDMPARVEGPSHFAHTITVVARAAGMSMDETEWELPLAQALQIYHAEMRWNGQWTARPGSNIPTSIFENFTIQAIDNPEPS